MDVRKIAHLARIELTEDEASRYQEQVGQIIKYVEQLKQVDVSGIEATAHAAPVFDIVREDAVTAECIPQEAVLANAPAVAHEQIKMPKVVD